MNTLSPAQRALRAQVADVLEARGWTRGALSRDKDGRGIYRRFPRVLDGTAPMHAHDLEQVQHPEAVTFCLLGALTLVTGAVQPFARSPLGCTNSDAMHFNDARRREDVLGWLRSDIAHPDYYLAKEAR